MFKKHLSILLVIVLMMGVFTAFPISASGKELEIVEVGDGDDYPSAYKNASPDTVVDRWNFYNRECTSFVAWCMESRNGISDFHNRHLTVNGQYYSVYNNIDVVEATGYGTKLGHAKYWGTAFRSMGFTVDNNPSRGAIAWWSGGTYGHVAWVTGVNGDDVYIEEYNYKYAHNYSSRTINRYNPSGYIHINDINPTPKGYVMSESEGAGRTIPDGDYWIGSKIAEDYFIDIPGNDFDTWNEKNVQTWKWDSGLPPIYDVFHMTYLNNGFYKITQLNTRMVIDVFGGNLERGSNVSMWEDTGSTAQQWSIEKTDGGYKIRSRGNNYYLDIYDGKYENGTNVLTWDNHEGDNQFFTFIPYTPNEKPVSDGKYKISSAVSSTCYLDVYGGFDDFKNLSNIEVYNSPDDTFQIEYLGNGYYRICELTSQLAVEVINDGEQSYLNNSRNVILYGKNNRKNQAWNIRKNNDGTFCFVNQLSGYYLDLEHANTDNGTNVSQYQYNGYNNQKWKLHRVIEENMITVGNIKSSIDTPEITVEVDGNLLEVDKDYTASFKYDVITKIYTTTIKGINNYCGSITKEVTISADEPTVIKLGDVDGDGKATIIDATLIQRHCVGITVNGEFNEAAADVDGSGDIEISDATFIQRYDANTETPYKIGEAIE